MVIASQNNFFLELYQSANVADRKEKVNDFNKVNVD